MPIKIKALTGKRDAEMSEWAVRRDELPFLTGERGASYCHTSSRRERPFLASGFRCGRAFAKDPLK